MFVTNEASRNELNLDDFRSVLGLDKKSEKDGIELGVSDGEIARSEIFPEHFS